MGSVGKSSRNFSVALTLMSVRATVPVCRPVMIVVAPIGRPARRSRAALRCAGVKAGSKATSWAGAPSAAETANAVKASSRIVGSNDSRASWANTALGPTRFSRKARSAASAVGRLGSVAARFNTTVSSASVPVSLKAPATWAPSNTSVARGLAMSRRAAVVSSDVSELTSRLVRSASKARKTAAREPG